MRISDWSSDVCSSDLFGLTPVWAQEMDHSMHQPPQQTESAPESSKPGDPHAGHDTASPQSTQASNEPAQPQPMEHSIDPKRVVSGKSVPVRVAIGGGRNLKNKTHRNTI